MGNYYLYRLGLFLADLFPFQVSLALVTFLCDIHYSFSRRDRQAVEDNLKVVLNTEHVPPQEVRRVFRNFGRYLLEFFTVYRRLEPGSMQSLIRIKNVECIHEVIKKGKGGIIVSAHLGNWELGGAVFPMLGFPLSVVALAHKDPRVNALFNAQRELFGAVVIQTDVAIRRVTEHLQQNRLVAILADRDFGTRGLLMEFLGRPTMIPKGAAFFSLKTGAPIIPMFILRKDDGHFEVNIYPSIEPDHLSNGKVTDEEAKEYIQKYLTTMENEIRKEPSQWLLFREFWQS
jgi:KDO2-lipid IV(A) lauroyltransferase